MTFDVAVAGVPGVPGDGFQLLLHYDSSLDDVETYGANIGVDVRFERHESFGGGFGLDVTHVTGAEIQISDSGPPSDCGTNRIAWGLTAGDGSNPPIAESCHPFMNPGPLPIDSLHPTLLDAHSELSGSGRCLLGRGSSGEPWRQIRLSFPVKVGGSNLNARRPLSACPCTSDSFTLAPGVHRIYPGVTLRREGGGDTSSRCTEGFTTYVRGNAATQHALLGPNWSHSLADRLSVHAMGVEQYLVLESYTGKWVMFALPAGSPPPQGRELQQVPEGEAMPELKVGDPAYCWDCKAWRLIQTTSGYMQVNRDGSRRVFSADGRLVRIEDHRGTNATLISWASEGGQQVINYVADATGHIYDFQYQLTPLRLNRIVLPGGRTWDLRFDTQGRLDRIQDPESFVTGLGSMQFAYASPSLPRRVNSIVSKTLPDGEVVTYEYYCDPGDPLDLPCSDCGLCGPLDFADNVRPGALKSAQIGPDTARKFRYAYGRPSEGRSWMLVEPPNPISGSATAPYQYLEYAPCGKGSREVAVPASSVATGMSWEGLTRALAPGAVITATRSDALGRVRSVQRGNWAGGVHDPWSDDENLVGPKVCFDYVGDGSPTSSAKLLRRRGPICHVGDIPGSFFECDDLAPNGDLCDPVDEMTWEEVVPVGGVLKRERLKAVVPASEIAAGSPTPRPWGLIYWPDTDPDGPGELRAICEPTEWSSVPGLSDPFLVEACDGESMFEYERAYSGEVVRLHRTVDGEGHATSLSYDPLSGLVSTVTDPLGHMVEFDYDPGTALLSTLTLPGDRKSSWSRNRRGQATFVALPMDGPTEFSTQYEYSAGGRLDRIRDLHRGTAWRFGYYSPGESSAGLPKLIEREPGPGGSTVTLEAWTWTPAGQLAATVFDWDLARVLSVARDELGSVTNRYLSGLPMEDECWYSDARTGRLVRVAFQTPWNDPAMACGDVVSQEVRYDFMYDDAGRLVGELFRSDLPGESTSHIQENDFDIDGHLVSRRAYSPTRGWIGETTSTHDAAGRVLDLKVYRNREDDPLGPDLLETLSYRLPDGSPAYDRDGRPLRRLDVMRNRETKWTWREDGRLTAQDVRDFNLLDPLVGSDVYTYDASTRLSRMEHRVPRPDIPALGYEEVFEFTHDKNDQLIYAHAHKDSLASGSVGGFTLLERYEHQYVYDRSWNLTELHDLLSSATTTFVVDGHDRLVGPKYAYDAGFNLTRKGALTEVHDEFTFDILNRLTQHRKVSSTGATLGSTDYSYDPFNRLIAIQDASGRRWRAYSGWDLSVDAETADPSGDWRFFQSGSGGQIGHVRPSQDFESYDWNLQGSREDVDQGTFAPIYEPYGKLPGTLSPGDSRITFQGHEWRQESELYYMRNRWYDPGLGRFLSVDPIRTSVVNSYQFAKNSPALKGDPLGLLPTWMEDRLNQEAGKPRVQLALLKQFLHQCTMGRNKMVLDGTSDVPLGLWFDHGPGWPSDAGGFYDPLTERIFIDEREFPPDGMPRDVLPVPSTAVPPEGMAEARTRDSQGQTVKYGGYAVPAGGSTAWDAAAETVGHEYYHAFRGPGVKDGLTIDVGTHHLAYEFGLDVLGDLWQCACP